MSLIADLVLQTSNSPGTGTFSLIAPVSGRVSFVNGNGAGQAYYVAHDGTNWEKGVGTVTAGSPDTLSRDTVIRNSLGTTAKVNFSSMVTLISDIPAERALHVVADNGSVAMSSRVITGLGAGVSTTDGAQLTQVGWQRIGADVVPSAGTGAIVFSLNTSRYLKFRLEWVSAVGTAAAAPYARFSQDGGGSYKLGATDYSLGVITQSGSTITGSVSAMSYAPLMSSTPVAGTATTGWLDIDPTNMQMTAHCVGINSSGTTITDTGFTVALTAAPTHVQFSFVSTTIAAVRARLLGWGF